jgi:hypothetical protein
MTKILPWAVLSLCGVCLVTTYATLPAADALPFSRSTANAPCVELRSACSQQASHAGENSIERRQGVTH